jgi:serine-type D-Ala-D-Ala carboxypeptidase (penicillin-binding protein 5/6)
MSICRHVAAIVAILFWPSAALAAPQPPDVACRACVVADVRGNVLWGRNAVEQLPNASTTKIVTALVVLENATMGERVTVSPEAASTPGGYLSLEAGQDWTVADLLHGLLMASSNDGAVALAEHVSGSEEAFVDEMNRVAAELGAEGTHFVTPHGLDTSGHVSTAEDLAALGAELLAEPRLAGIVKSTSYTLSDGTEITNSNPLLDSYNGATGIKTGTTAEAGQVLVASATRSVGTTIAVALGSPDARADATELLDFGFALLTRRAPAPAARRFATVVMASVRDFAAVVTPA